jgi:PAS domain S-box-containing protein
MLRKALTFSDNQESIDQIEQKLRGMEISTSGTFALTDNTFSKLLIKSKPDFIFVDASYFETPEFNIFSHTDYLSRTFTGSSIIILCKILDAHIQRNFLQAGAQDCLLWNDFLQSDIEKNLFFARERQVLRSRFKKIANDYKQLFDANPLPMWVYNADNGQFIKVNEAACQKYGYSAKEFYQLTIHDLKVDTTAKNIVNTDHVITHLTKSGEHIYVELTSHQTIYKGTDAVLVLAHDVTSKVKAEQEKNVASKQLFLIFEHSSDAILLTDNEGKILESNSASEELFNTSKKFLQGKSLVEIVKPEFNTPFASVWSKFHTVGKHEGKISIKSTHKDTKIASWRALANIREGIHLHIFNDVTEFELKARENELNSRILSSIKDSFTLKDTLNAISNNIRLFTGWESVEFWIPDSQNKILFLASSSANPHNAQFVKFAEASRNRMRGYEEKSISNNSWRSRSAYWFSDLYNHDSFSRQELLDPKLDYTAVSIPIFESSNNDQIVGIIILITDQKVSYDSYLIGVLSKVAGGLGNLIEKVKAREELSNLFDYSADLICIADKNGFLIKTNPAFSNVLGFTVEELKSKKFTDLIHPEDLETSAQEIAKLYHGEIIRAHANRYRTKSGTYRHFAWVAVPDPNGKQVFVIGRDVTELKAQTDLILKNAEQTRNMLESITDGFISVDKSWNVNYWNASAERILGIAKEEVLNQNCLNLLQELSPQLATMFEEASQKHTSLFIETYLPKQNIWIESTAYPSNEGLSVYIRDITLAKEHSLAIATMQKNLEAIINATSELIWSVDKEYNLTIANKAYFELLSDLVGKPIDLDSSTLRESLSEAIQAKWRAYYERCMQGQPHSVIEDLATYHPTGKRLKAIVNFNPIYDHQGNITGVACFAKDISELTQKMETIDQQSNQLKEIAWFQSHAVRQPLAKILGIVDFLEVTDTELDKETAQLLTDLKGSAQELDDVVKTIVNKAQRND